MQVSLRVVLLSGLDWVEQSNQSKAWAEITMAEGINWLPLGTRPPPSPPQPVSQCLSVLTIDQCLRVSASPCISFLTTLSPCTIKLWQGVWIQLKMQVKFSKLFQTSCYSHLLSPSYYIGPTWSVLHITDKLQDSAIWRLTCPEII
jgi:hypothetical protein